MAKKLYRGALTTIILALLRERDELYGYEIVQEVKKRTQGAWAVTEGALYPALHKLEGAGHLTVVYREYNNRTRKYYRLTEQGRAEEANLQAEMESFLQSMQALLNPKLT